jgi:osmotically inducible protein OsmC
MRKANEDPARTKPSAPTVNKIKPKTTNTTEMIIDKDYKQVVSVQTARHGEYREKEGDGDNFTGPERIAHGMKVDLFSASRLFKTEKHIMAAIERTATGVWRGDLRGGSGQIDSTSGVLQATPFTFATRFENAKGTNPEELIAAAHAACFSMAFANYLSQQGHAPEEISTQATITLDDGSINKMHLVTQGRVPGVDEIEFKRLAEEAEKSVPSVEPFAQRTEHHS